jgi:hypothetical protein
MVMHLELRFDGPLDVDVVTARLAALGHSYSRLGARIERSAPRWRSVWVDAPPRAVEVLRVGPGELEAQRARWISSPLDLGDGPGIELTIVDDGTTMSRLMIRAHHGALDGQSLVVAAAGLSDDHDSSPSPWLQPRADATRDRDGSPQPDGRAGGRLSAVRALRRIVLAERAARLAPAARPSSRVAGYGVTCGALGRDQVSGLESAARRHGVSVNDLLVAAMHLTCAEWSRERSHKNAVIRVTVPFSLRSPSGDGARIGNATSQLATVSHPRDRVDVDVLIAAVAQQIRAARDRAEPDPVPWVPVVSRLPLPIGAAVTRAGSALTGHAFLDTTRLSNLGHLPPMSIGGASVVGAWFSPPTRLPQGVAWGVVRCNGTIGISLRWCSERWTAPAAQSLMDLASATIADLT